MLGWRRRKDGFEWREYVRTTILVRRKNRRERVEQAGVAAVQGLKAAGERGAAAGALGAQAIGRGAKVAGAAAGRGAMRGAMAASQQGMALGAAAGRGAKVAGERGVVAGAAALRLGGEKLREGIPIAARGLRTGSRGTLAVLAIIWDKVSAGALWLARTTAPALAGAGRRLQPALAGAGRLLQPALSGLRQPNLAMPLAIAGGVALLGAAARGIIAGFDRDTLLALATGVVILAALLLARDPARSRQWLAVPIKGVADRMSGGLGRFADLRERLGPASRPAAHALGLALMLAIIGAGGWLAWRGVAAAWSRIGPAHADAIKGRAVAVSGDTLRIASATIAIAGIEAPVSGQTCASSSPARRWRCDAEAKSALARLAEDGQVTCRVNGTDGTGRKAGTCYLGDRDLAAELVRGGHVFAETGLFAAYSSLEQEARTAKRGIWSGEAERPADYRAHKWQDAKRDAPDGCPIKGEVKGGRRIYVLPWSRDYARARVSTGRGGRWFCTEAEAQAAGWKPSDRS